VVDAGGNITVAGYTISDTTPRVWYFTVWRFDSNGNLLPGWPQYPGNNQAYGTGVVIDSNGDIVCCGGNTWTGLMVLVKYRPNGSLVAGWPRTYQVSGQFTFGYGLIQDSDGNYVVAGYTDVAGPAHNAVLYKLDMNGDYCLVGRSQGTTVNDGKLLVTRYSKNGDQLTSSGWPQIYPRDGSMFYGFPRVFNRAGFSGETRSCGVDGLSNIYTVGYSRSNTSPDDDYSTFVIKYPPEYV